MSNHPPHSHDPKAKADYTQRPPTSDEQLRSFWLKNEKKIYTTCLFVIVVVAAVFFVRNMGDESEKSIRADYAAAATPEKLRAFIAANPSHTLAAVAEIRLADQAYSEKKYTEAAASYEKAAANKDALFSGRAQLGLAMSKILGGQASDGESRLNQIANNNNLAASVRAEAAYHLGTISATAGRTADALKYYDQASQVASDTLWAYKAADQRERLSPSAPAPAVSGSTAPAGLPSVSFP